jgi:type I restriction enzyme S subunit
VNFQSKFPLVKLVDVAPITTERVSQFDGLKPYVATADVQDGQIVASVNVDYKNKPSRADISINANDVIFARMQSTNKVLLIGNLEEKFIFSTGFAVCRPTQKILPKYLKYWLVSDIFNEQKDSYCTGATQKAIPNSGIEKIFIPLPSILEQERIVRLLNEAESLRATRSRANKRMEQFVPALFHKIFGDPVKNEKGWTKKTIAEVGKVSTGNTPPTTKKEYYGDEIEWIKSDNINTSFDLLTQAKVYLSKEGKKVGRVVPAGSVLVTCIAGNSSTIGNAAIADREVAFNQQINAITPNELVDTNFLYAQILALRSTIKSNSSGGMKGIVNKSTFEKIPVIVPPLALQREFAARVEEARGVQSAQGKSAGRVEALYQSMLSRAFAGEL